MATAKPSPKRLTRSRDNRMILGVCGGVADYFNVDPTIVRLVWVILTAFTGFVFGVAAYVVAAIIMPED